MAVIVIVALAVMVIDVAILAMVVILLFNWRSSVSLVVLDCSPCEASGLSPDALGVLFLVLHVAGQKVHVDIATSECSMTSCPPLEAIESHVLLMNAHLLNYHFRSWVVSSRKLQLMRVIFNSTIRSFI